MSNINVEITGPASLNITINGGDPVTKAVKPTVTAVGNNLHFVCDDIDETILPNEVLTIDGVTVQQPPPINQYTEQAKIFNAQMADLFSGNSSGVSGIDTTLAQGQPLTANRVIEVGENALNVSSNDGTLIISFANGRARLRNPEEFADNAAALSAGLTNGTFYIRTGHGLDVAID